MGCKNRLEIFSITPPIGLRRAPGKFLGPTFTGYCKDSVHLHIRRLSLNLDFDLKDQYNKQRYHNVSTIEEESSQKSDDKDFNIEMDFDLKKRQPPNKRDNDFNINMDFDLKLHSAHGSDTIRKLQHSSLKYEPYLSECAVLLLTQRCRGSCW